MRSIFIHFPVSEDAVVRAWLNRHAERKRENEWVVRTVEPAAIYCSIFDDYGDWEAEELSAIRSVMAVPTAFVQVDVSGRISGDVEVRELTLGLLKAVPGAVAQDDYTHHLWTHREISDGASVEGYVFFDYRRRYARDGD